MAALRSSTRFCSTGRVRVGLRSGRRSVRRRSILRRRRRRRFLLGRLPLRRARLDRLHQRVALCGRRLAHLVRSCDHLEHLAPREARLAQHIQRARDLLDARREGAHAAAGLDVRRGAAHRVPRLRQVEDEAVDALKLDAGRVGIREALGAHVAVPAHDTPADAIRLELGLRELRALRVELEGVQRAARTDGARERVRERAGAGAGLDDDAARQQLELQADHRDVGNVEDLRAVRQGLRP